MAPFLPLAPNRFRWYFPFGSLFRLWQKLSKEGRLVALLHATASMNQAIASQQLVKRLTRCAEQGPSNCQVSRNLSRWSMTWRRTTQTLHHLIFRFVSLCPTVWQSNRTWLTTGLARSFSKLRCWISWRSTMRSTIRMASRGVPIHQKVWQNFDFVGSYFTLSFFNIGSFKYVSKWGALKYGVYCYL